MDKGVKRLLEEAKTNQEFNREAMEADPVSYLKPDFWSCDMTKLVYATVYYGWLIAKGRYKRSNYYY